uniref:uncharacterized protein LOC120338099 n=1 Tax=Styela clava TaxID=7725 RepID=UPI00193A4818|nr:uncharacterized protein LOC120338099 [Styela clava]
MNHIHINWTKIHETQPWYDVIDVPTPEKTVGCWDFVNFTFTEGGSSLKFTTKEFKSGEEHDLHLQRNENDCNYHIQNSNKRQLKQIYQEFNQVQSVSTSIQDINVEAQQNLEAGFSFITDYQNYFIIINCLEKDWTAFVKARTRQITALQLQMISDALVNRGFYSPIMTLKNLCVHTKDQSDLGIV